MSFNGSGTFVINTAGQPVVANTVISATVFNALTADLATGLSTCITKDGQTTITANIPFGSNKITGLGAATAATDAATFGQVQSTAAKLITVTGTDTITGTMSPALTAYAAGQLFYFIANAANTGAMTINIDGLGAKAITRDGSTALIAGDVNTGEIVVICYDGTRFQMINAANSFGNTTINGTLTVTGNTGLQANVSITSTLSVGGTFAVTGAATLGSTLSVTGKSDLPVVSTASMNAAVAVITTGTVTNLTSTSASIASMNAGVALLTNATVTTLTATGASIASANIGNLQFTAASIASINAGVAVITNLTATGASIASMNAGVALLTTATVTNLTATGASIASANAGNLQVTGASVASANVGVALITTGTVTALTATGASIGSANVGTAVVTGLTVTNASIASANAGTATLSGNLTLNGGTANGVLYLNGSKVATSGSAVTYDGTTFGTTGAANFATSSGNVGIGNTTGLSGKLGVSGNLSLSGAGTGSRYVALLDETASYAGTLNLQAGGGSAGFGGGIAMYGHSHATYPGATWIGYSSGSSTGILFGIGGNGVGSELMRLTSTGLGIGTSSPSSKLTVAGGAVNLTSNSSNHNIYQGTGWIWTSDGTSSGTTRAGIYGNSNGTLSLFGGSTISSQVTLDSSGNLGLGVTPSAWNITALQVKNGSMYGAGSTEAGWYSNAYYDSGWKYISNGASAGYVQNGNHQWFVAGSGTAGNAISFTQALTLDASGYLLLNTTSTTGNGKFANAHDSASLATASSSITYTKCQGSDASNNATVDAFTFLDAAGNIIGDVFISGHFYVYVRGASGVNAFSGVYSIVTTGDGTSDATLAAVSTVTRGTSPVSSVQIANNGANGSVKLTITYINNSGVVAGGSAKVSFVGLCSQS